jgi:hypothetical protein
VAELGATAGGQFASGNFDAAKRCGAECTREWNDTVGKALNLKLSVKGPVVRFFGLLDKAKKDALRTINASQHFIEIWTYDHLLAMVQQLIQHYEVTEDK